MECIPTQSVGTRNLCLYSWRLTCDVGIYVTRHTTHDTRHPSLKIKLFEITSHLHKMAFAFYPHQKIRRHRKPGEVCRIFFLRHTCQ